MHKVRNKEKTVTTDYEENKTFCKDLCVTKDTTYIMMRQETDLKMIFAIHIMEKR